MKHGAPDIFDTDQGSQLRARLSPGVLIANTIAISIHGKIARRDNVFVKHIWKSIMCEEVYLHAYGGVSMARASLGRYPTFMMDCTCIPVLHIPLLTGARPTMPTSFDLMPFMVAA
jgi:hypothetical protein